jgi:hypothetical protein
MSSEEKVEGRYIAILRYENSLPVYHTPPQIISADNFYDAVDMFHRLGVSCFDVVPYVEDDKLFTDEEFENEA